MSQTVYSRSPLVETMDDFFDRSGPIPTRYDDLRRFPRFYFRSCAAAVIHPFAKRPDSESAEQILLTCDLSRTGLRLLHHEQLFPGQRVDVTLNGDPPRCMEVVWCKRYGSERFTAGCRFVSATAD